MARLVIRLLGSFQASLDGELIDGFHSDKVRALLTYLCVEGERPHRRERLAGLLWIRTCNRREATEHGISKRLKSIGEFKNLIIGKQASDARRAGL